MEYNFTEHNREFTRANNNKYIFISLMASISSRFSRAVSLRPERRQQNRCYHTHPRVTCTSPWRAGQYRACGFLLFLPPQTRSALGKGATTAHLPQMRKEREKKNIAIFRFCNVTGVCARCADMCFFINYRYKRFY